MQLRRPLIQTKKKKILCEGVQRPLSCNMMKIKHWISGSGNGQDGGNSSAAATKKLQQTTTVIKSSSTVVITETKQPEGPKEHPAEDAGVVAKLRPTSLNVNQLNYNVVDLKKFIR